MDTFSVVELSASMGKVIDRALAHPVLITRHKRAVVVMINADEYERLVQLEQGLTPQEEAKGT